MVVKAGALFEKKGGFLMLILNRVVICRVFNSGFDRIQ
jgi:hypothetical protein